ncbi:LuxR family transcriptional regulator [Actinomadura logoneensis]|uniref:LuxR family transcriptional regulator n=1 Tax=Actinomadura logoneensis TaxID=2293572 RepID=A0A372JU69_9ACTN|nr:LuxR family transcriptional regulator [Actinomadura logoneensis]RFU43557.1 LuxR family transcriptional regulator [Actinomadura logoneensis]
MTVFQDDRSMLVRVGLVDRERELATVREQIGHGRPVTLTGVGGVGKTRLALRAAQELRAAFPDGAWFVRIDEIRHPALLAHGVTAAMGVVDQPGRSQAEVLLGFLAARRALVVLDGCEHLREAVGDLVGMLREGAPDVRFIATARQALAMPGEYRLVVRPLPVPAEADCERLTFHPADLRRLSRIESVRLFAVRAAEAAPGFALTARNAAQVARLCRRLDGIPFAIELAAVRMREMPLDEVLGRLHDRFAVLGAARPGLPRHQTLRTAIGWSHELCTPAERLLWARLSVFEDGFDGDAVGAVCADDRLPAGDVPALLARLVDKSILYLGDHDDGTRYRLLGTVREYGLGWLRLLGEERRMRRRHRDHYLEVARRVDRDWFGAHQFVLYRELLADLGNYRAALAYDGAGEADRRAALDLAAALWPLWIVRGLTREGRYHLERVLADDPPPGPERARARCHLAWVAFARADVETACATAEAARREALDHDDQLLALRARMIACVALGTSGTLPGEAHASETSPGGSGGIGTFSGEAVGGGTGARGAGGQEGSDALGNRGREPRPASGDVAREAALVLTETLDAILASRAGRPDDLDPLLALGVIGLLLDRCGELDQAADLLVRAVELCAGHGDLWWWSHLDWILARVELRRNRPAEASGRARTALAIKLEFQDAMGAALQLEVLAAAAVALGGPVRAARLHGVAASVLRTATTPGLSLLALGDVHAEAERAARERLGDASYERERDAGAVLDEETAIAYALGPDDRES